MEVIEVGDGTMVCGLDMIGEDAEATASCHETATGAVLSLMDVTAAAAAVVAVRTRNLDDTGDARVVAVRVSNTITAFPRKGEHLVARSCVVSHTPTLVIIETTVTGTDNRRLARGWRTNSLGR